MRRGHGAPDGDDVSSPSPPPERVRRNDGFAMTGRQGVEPSEEDGEQHGSCGERGSDPAVVEQRLEPLRQTVVPPTRGSRWRNDRARRRRRLRRRFRRHDERRSELAQRCAHRLLRIPEKEIGGGDGRHTSGNADTGTGCRDLPPPEAVRVVAVINRDGSCR